MAKRYEICPATDLPPGERLVADLDICSVGIFNVDGEYHAVKNDCPHQRAPLCEGKWTGTTTADRPGEYEWDRDERIVRCPWHGWEFDVRTGESVFNPHSVKAKTFDTAVETAESLPDGGECCEHGVELQGDEPPVETYDVEVEEETLVVYI